MTKQRYELINNQRTTVIDNFNRSKSCSLSLLTLLFLCILLFSSIFIFWNEVYNKRLNIPQISNDIPFHILSKKIEFYSNIFQDIDYKNHNKSSINANFNNTKDVNNDDDQIVINGSKFGNFIYSNEKEKHSEQHDKKLICYYTTPRWTKKKKSTSENFNIKDLSPNLCNFIHVGIVEIVNCSLVINQDLINAFQSSNELKKRNDKLKVLIWIGGADESVGFKDMVFNHANRKLFIQSVKKVLEKYALDGIDLDWEFPNGSNSQRSHFMQLLHEIRREYQREHSTYLLSIAVAAPSVFVDMCYDVRMINENVDYVNIMTYDYHFYSKGTPYTGLNAPLYARSNDIGFFETLNINHSVNYWMSKGLDRSKIIIGLPTYGHSFKLVNPFNTKIGAPAEDFGSTGTLGFVSYSDICLFQKTNYNVRVEYDAETCSPFLHTGLEWISYDNERSIECKTNYVKKNQFGGIMVFSLNTDDFRFTCSDKQYQHANGENKNFPLLRKIHSILFNNSTK